MGNNTTPVLTTREYEVLICLADGLTSIETAERLYLSFETIKSHRRSLMLKLDARSSFQLGVLAMKHGLFKSQQLAATA